MSKRDDDKVPGIAPHYRGRCGTQGRVSTNARFAREFSTGHRFTVWMRCAALLLVLGAGAVSAQPAPQRDLDHELLTSVRAAEEALQKALDEADASRAGLVYLWMREFSDARFRTAPDKSAPCLTAVLLIKALSNLAAEALDKSDKDELAKALQTDPKVLRTSIDQYYDEYASMKEKCEVAAGVAPSTPLLARRPSEMLR